MQIDFNQLYAPHPTKTDTTTMSITTPANPNKQSFKKMHTAVQTFILLFLISIGNKF